MKAVLLDLFGTLVDNMTNAEVEQFRHDVADTLTVEREEFKRGWSATFPQRAAGNWSTAEMIAAAADLCSAKYSPAGLECAVAIRRDFMRRWLTPRHDAVSTLRELKQKGFRIGLLSNCSSEVPELWPSLEFAPLIEFPLFSCREGLRKPMPEFFFRALERLEVTPPDCLYVADGDSGELAASKALGMPAMMIRNGDDEFRIDSEEWDGPRIERLSELLQHESLQSCL
ncbi:MAG TPA: HAD family hydrolase [Candidatus Kapabacteria bacterium]|nr:HAD family hydrolase [Candidatus Kapabacteria bacterium]